MSRPILIPVDLGGSPTECWRRPPLRPVPTPDLVRALIEHYRTERASGAALEVAFFHGGLPEDALMAAASGLPIRLACSPADLSRAAVARLMDGGLKTIEVALGSLDARVLRTNRIGVRRAVLLEMLESLGELGLRVGVVLSPGLPDASHDTALTTARALIGRAEFVRIEPTLALSGSRLSELADSGRWEPMSLGEAVTTTLAMVEILEDAGVEIARLGLQPGQDIPCRATAGPVHPNLRQLVEFRRFYARMAHELALVPRGSQVELQVNPRDLSWAKGTANTNVRALRAAHALASLRIRTDEDVPRGDVRLLAVSA
ncbi:MAG: hypothetical protein P8R54_21090 [Myxococcota bacterium]|nr:hypothetical protein [Myxococcota bacterium]